MEKSYDSFVDMNKGEEQKSRNEEEEESNHDAFSVNSLVR
jgi:hypothetical protein